jgi:hypothetical protein
MRRLLAVLALVIPAAAFAQQPPNLEPLPEPPPPPVGVTEDSGEPGVTIERGEQRIEEFTVDGQRYIRVIQPNGWEYYLIEAEAGAGPWAGARDPHDNRIRAPQWQILQW